MNTIPECHRCETDAKDYCSVCGTILCKYHLPYCCPTKKNCCYDFKRGKPCIACRREYCEKCIDYTFYFKNAANETVIVCENCT